MVSARPTEDREFSAERRLPFALDRVWAQCTSKRGLESWWAPEDLRVTVRRFDPRSGGEVEMALRYLPAMLAPDREGAFRAAGIPISLVLRGKIRELEPHRRLVLELTLTLDRAGAGIETITRLDLAPVPEGTQVKLTVSGKTNPHWATLGQANLEGQLDRLGRSLGRASEAPL